MSLSTLVIPPSQEVRDKLVATQAEARFLRRLLKLARERDEAITLRAKCKVREQKT